MRSILLAERAARPSAVARDFLKLLHQSEFGGGHMIADRAKSLEHLRSECAALEEAAPSEPFSPVGDGLLRLDLRAVAPLGLRLETVNGLFVQTANAARGSAGGLEEKLRLLTEMAGELGLDEGALRLEIDAWRESGFPPVGHSEPYRAAHAPAYRLVPAAAEMFLPLFQAMDGHLTAKGRARVAIDGQSAAGKSTLGALLADVYGGNLYHMDDFFLPPARKTPRRLAEPGGNVDRERFHAEILSKLGAPFAYRPYNCRTDALEHPIHALPKPVEIVEGAYSLHPLLENAYDLKVLLVIEPDLQRERIRRRGGPEMLRRFEREWIPLENRYFAALAIRERCHLVFEIS